eukprot:TRINITY_DN1535_c0_g3_i1.p1 TRINITY_DN1535_c0_g3~~TRINITY_DN1535_c0_g3_i1.p1  ORF type:complete len:225 (-),score=52.94 TRINITY_DN1535_c0_g3_i1:59-733(-)
MIEGEKFVQKGIYYSPHVDFICFDIHFSNAGFVGFDRFTEICDEIDLPHTYPLLRGTFDECMKYDPYFVTTLPERIHDLPRIENNIAEGVVVKPVIPKSTYRGLRIIFKIKNDKFSEITGGKNNKKKLKLVSKKDLIKIDDAVIDKFLCYVNENRLNNVISKIGSVSVGEENKLSGMLAKDAFEDFFKDNKELYDTLKTPEKKRFKKSLPNLCRSTVQDYFKNQ